jgi:hypothetical protein
MVDASARRTCQFVGGRLVERFGNASSHLRHSPRL